MLFLSFLLKKLYEFLMVISISMVGICGKTIHLIFNLEILSWTDSNIALETFHLADARDYIRTVFFFFVG